MMFRSRDGSACDALVTCEALASPVFPLCARCYAVRERNQNRAFAHSWLSGRDGCKEGIPSYACWAAAESVLKLQLIERCSPLWALEGTHAFNSENRLLRSAACLYNHSFPQRTPERLGFWFFRGVLKRMVL